MSYIIHEAVGNFSRTIETFDTLEEAQEHLEDIVREEIREEYTTKEIEANEEMYRDLAFSYYSIEEAIT